ncbi:hypothetical protein GCM10009105_10380 [Dokdonella soli]|uniref:DUF3096 domain-containing protein n=1 Tax=Dokdonella soli TaxID=529810 RepID=A0ABN1IEJ0_9GAMM
MFATERIAAPRWHTLRLAYKRDSTVNLHLSIGPLVSLIAGILILVMPRLLNFIVAIYLIIIGLIGLFGAGTIHL